MYRNMELSNKGTIDEISTEIAILVFCICFFSGRPEVCISKLNICDVKFRQFEFEWNYSIQMTPFLVVYIGFIWGLYGVVPHFYSSVSCIGVGFT